MSKLNIAKGSTSQILEIFIQDSSSAAGSGLPNLNFNSAGLQCYYHRNTSASVVQLSLASGIVGTFVPSGFVAVDNTKMPGFYQICLPDSAYATGANSVAAVVRGAASMLAVPMEIQLSDANIGYIAISGINRDSFSNVYELSSAPVTPCNPIDLILWNYTRAKHKTMTKNDVDYVYKADGTTVLASGQLYDDGQSLVRQRYL